MPELRELRLCFGGLSFGGEHPRLQQGELRLKGLFLISAKGQG